MMEKENHEKAIKERTEGPGKFKNKEEWEEWKKDRMSKKNTGSLTKDPKKGQAMKKSTKLRLLGGIVLLFNLWLIGRYNLGGIPILLLTFGFAAGYEYFVVRHASKSEK